MWRYDETLAACAAELMSELEKGNYIGCYDRLSERIVERHELAEYLPPVFFRRLAVSLFPTPHCSEDMEWKANMVLAHMSAYYPEKEEIGRFLPQRHTRRTQ